MDVLLHDASPSFGRAVSLDEINDAIVRARYLYSIASVGSFSRLNNPNIR